MGRGSSEVEPVGVAAGSAHPRVAQRVKRRARATLGESETRFRATFAQAAVGIAHVGLDGRFLLVNDKLCEILGYPRAELLQRTVKDVSHPDDRNVTDAARARLLAGEIATFSFDKRYRRKDGNDVWVRLTVSLAGNVADKATYDIAVFEDITAHKRAELDLEDSLSLLRATLEATADGILAISASGRISSYNKRFQEMWRIPDEVLATGDNDRAFAYALDQVKDREVFAARSRVIYGDPDAKTVDVVEFKDGRIFERCTIPQKVGGRTIGRVCSFSDVTEHRRAELALQESEERYRKLIERSPDAIMVFVDNRLVFANAAAVRLFGASCQDEIIGRHAYQMAPPEYRDRVRQRLAQLEGEADGVPLMEQVYVRLDGTRVPVEAATSRLSFRGAPAIQTVARDISERKRAEAALRASEERFQYAVRGSLAGLWDWNVAEGHYYLSPHFKSMLGYGEHELPNERAHLFAHLHPDDRPGVENAVSRHFEQREPYDVEYRIRCKDGQMIWCHSVGQAVWDEDGRVTRFSGSTSDITARKQAEQRIGQLIAERNTLLENALVGIAFLKDRQVMQCNQAFAEMFGYQRAEVLGVSTRHLHESEDAYEERGREAYPVVAERGSFTADARMRHKDGGLFWVNYRLSAIDRGDLGQGVVWVVQDITERKQAEERLLHLAHHDVLTQLPNRSLFRDRLNQALAQARRNDSMVGVMFIDIDRFKVTNDTLGHEGGDRVLRSVADRLSSSLRAGDTVARLGGDEFAVILSGIGTVRTAGKLAQKILDILAQPVVVDEREVYVSASIGVTVYPADSDDPEMLIRNADVAMYRAKEQGGNTCQYFTTEINARALRYVNLETGLRQALAHDQFRLHFQPKVDIASERITGVEALLRWQYPEHGLLAPGEFVPLLEESGLIVAVGEWVLTTACRQARTWEQAGFPRVPMAINVSARQFRRSNFAKTVARVLRETGLSPSQLELEITESAMMLDIGADTPAFTELKALGVGLSIDDFGTGYSSLNYLKRFDVDSLKIDRAFIKDVTLQADNDAITTAIIAMAHALDCKVIAEGVETRAQLEFLADHGCDEYQGYLFSEPLDAEKFACLWRSRSAVTTTIQHRRAMP